MSDIWKRNQHLLLIKKLVKGMKIIWSKRVVPGKLMTVRIKIRGVQLPKINLLLTGPKLSSEI